MTRGCSSCGVIQSAPSLSVATCGRTLAGTARPVNAGRRPGVPRDSAPHCEARRESRGGRWGRVRPLTESTVNEPETTVGKADGTGLAYRLSQVPALAASRKQRSMIRLIDSRSCLDLAQDRADDPRHLARGSHPRLPDG